ncbi:MAG: hypothetical protein MMC33_002064 [Icmadophila ericetorum]|nr:hypothetical protein [Icmadophila ericetorum]
MGILKDVEVFVKVNGQKLKEYIDQDDAEDSTTHSVKYVEAKDAAVFEVSFASLVPFDLAYHGPQSCQGLRFSLTVDGQKIHSLVLNGTLLTGKISGVEQKERGGWILKPFTFAQIETSEIETRPMYLHAILTQPEQAEERIGTQAQELKDRVSKIGKIEIGVIRVRNVTIAQSTWEGPNVKSLKPVPEKALKGQALSHGTSLGKSETIAPPTYVSCEYLDDVSKPYLNFEFRYRSRKALQNMFIIPRSPSPSPPLPLEDRPPESLSREELLELVNRRLPAIKREIKVKPGETSRNLKRERDEEYRAVLASARPSKVNRGQKIEVIDLLDD